MHETYTKLMSLILDGEGTPIREARLVEAPSALSHVQRNVGILADGAGTVRAATPDTGRAHPGRAPTPQPRPGKVGLLWGGPRG